MFAFPQKMLTLATTALSPAPELLVDGCHHVWSEHATHPPPEADVGANQPAVHVSVGHLRGDDRLEQELQQLPLVAGENSSAVRAVHW